MLNPRSIALIGLSGAGKSSVGRLLAERLGWPLRDTDTLVAQAAGRGVPQIFAEDGEAHFRDLEVAALRAALSGGPCVVATGGGIVLRAENRALLRERAFVAWLDAPTGALVDRLRAHDQARPLLQGDDPAARLESLRAGRAALYSEVCDMRVATDGLTTDQVCDAVLRRYATGETREPSGETL